jgi:hypothetical protein
MKCAFAHSGRGLFHKQLGIPKTVKIPEAWLRVIVKTTIGNRAYNPTGFGDRWIRVTPLVKYRATLLLTADRINRKGSRK